jgi:hypothetical protein
MNQYGAVLYALDIGQAELAAMKDRMWQRLDRPETRRGGDQACPSVPRPAWW